MWKLNFSFHLSIGLNFRHTSKKFKGGAPKKILEKKNVFPKKYVELRTFDGKVFLLAGEVGGLGQIKRLQKSVEFFLFQRETITKERRNLPLSYRIYLFNPIILSFYPELIF